MLLCGCYLSASLRLHYDFSSVKNGIMPDLSGSGHDGVVSGAFSAVSFEDAQGMSFNGNDNCITPKNPETLKANGAFTLFLSFRITPEQAKRMKGKSPLVYGSIDGKSVNRNCSLFFDNGRLMEFDVGNGKTYSCVTLTNIADGKRHSVAFVLDAPYLLLYLDGKCVSWRSDFENKPSSEIGLPEICVGNWHSGCFEGDMFELRVYDEALSTDAVGRISGVKEAAGFLGEVKLRHSDYLSRLEYTVFADQLPANATQVEYLVDGRSCFKRPLSKDELSVRRIYRRGDTLKTADFPCGEHGFKVVFLDKSGAALDSVSAKFVKTQIAEPEKFSNSLGISDDVLPPWTPMSVKQSKNETVVSMWNRDYVFGAMPFSGVIKTNGMSDFGEALVGISVDGKEMALKAGDLAVEKSGKNQVVLVQRAFGDSVAVEARHIIDYDGFDRVKVTLTALKNAQVDKLLFRFALDGASVNSVVRKLGNVEMLSKKASFGFEPLLFLAGEKRGLSYLCDSDQFWFPKNNPNAISLKREENGKLLFDIQPVNETVPIKKGQAFTYEFGIAATPYRPVVGSAWTRRYGRILPYCGELASLKTQRNGTSVFDYYANIGMKGFVVWKTGKAFSYPAMKGTDYGDRLSELVKKAHEKGMKVFPYAIGFLFSELAPEANEAAIYVAEPVHDYSKLGDYLEKESGYRQHSWIVCNSKHYQDLMLYRLKNAIEQIGIDGVYLDSLAGSMPCMNALHGCGYVDDEGVRHQTYNGFATRDFMRRIYTLVYQLKGTDGVVDLHASGDFNAAAAAWATSMWSGEHIRRNRYAFAALSPEAFRNAYTGANIGVEVEFLHYCIKCGYRAASSLTLVHNVVVRPSEDGDIEELRKIWDVREKMGLDAAQFIGYWEKDCPVFSRQKGIYASCYRKGDGALVAIVSNLSPERQTVNLEARASGIALPEAFDLDSQDFVYLDLSEKR